MTCNRVLWPVVFAAVLILVVLSAAGSRAAEDSNRTIHVEKWLMLGPADIPLPAFNDEGEAKIGAGELLGYEHIPVYTLTPAGKSRVHRALGDDLIWREETADTTGVAIQAQGDRPAAAYLAAYVDAPRWLKIDLEARCTQPFEIFVDGESVIKRAKSGGMAGGDAAEKGKAKLKKGKHLVIVKTVSVPRDSLPEWRFDLTVSAGKGFDADPVVSLEPVRSLTIHDILDGPDVGSVRVSPDGELVAVTVSKRVPPEGDSDGWLEIHRVKDGSLVETLRDLSGASDWQWAPDGHKLSYVATKDEAASLRVVNLDDGTVETVLERVKDFSGYRWSCDGSFIAYALTEKPEKDKTGVKRVRNVADRRRNERERSSLYVAPVPAGMTRRITGGEHSVFTYDIHPENTSILVGRTYEDLSERPYSKTELVRLGLDDDSTELLLSGGWIGSAVWSPDGAKILLTASPSEFGDTGVDVEGGVIPNDYDTQAYLFDPKTKTAEALTKHFDPSIRSAYWPKPGDDIVFTASDGEYSRLYRYNLKKQTFTAIDLECDVIRRSDVADDKLVAVVSGSGASQPDRLYAVDIKRGKSTLLLDKKKDRFENVRLGRVEDWSFEAGSGKTIAGRIHYPPDFDPGKKWPCIVYYYGGTSPVDRSFGGRYPKNLWAAYGYVVYVLQPSGATGFGQEFSARHVNDWGKTVAGEIIEGTEKFLAAHEFVDPKRVGCIGASFGGFMTQLVITKTDIFAAAVSHAGISSISSYWGEGYWGYTYNSVSAANSFPWNRPDIYIDQSPLFAADKITTPLLLLHGTADTNVPPGESEQMYTALKLLGKEVEYLKIGDQNHFVLDYKKRIIWSDAIVSWFDKWLKGEAEWWDDVYPPLDDGGDADDGDDDDGRPDHAGTP